MQSEDRTTTVPVGRAPLVLSAINNSIPVLLLCCNTHVGALGALRSLGRWGVPTYAIDLERLGRLSSSRYCKACFEWDPLISPVETSLQKLLQVGRQFESKAMLVPTFDEAAIFAATYQDRLNEVFLYPRQSAAMIRSLVSKREMFLLAQRLRIPVPATIWPQSRREVAEFSQDAQYPVALKAIRGMRLKLKAGVTAFIVSSAEELMKLYDMYEDADAPNLMLQEYIPGDDSCGWGFNGYFNYDSECLLGGTTRRLHQNPVHVGITSLAVVEENPEILQLSQSFMKAIGFCGLVNIGFRFDARDNQYKAVDVNPRLGASFRSFTTVGDYDILRACYLDMTGQEVPDTVPRNGRKWMLELDLRSCLDYHREGKPFRKILHDCSGVQEMAYSSIVDPAPIFSMLATGVIRPLRRWLKSVNGRPAQIKTPGSAFGI